MICLGIESTAHTLGIGIVEDDKILANVKDVYKPKHGAGIHPIEAKEHHEKVKYVVLQKALEEAKINLNDIDIFSYSAGPGLPPCLKVGSEFVSLLSTEIKRPIVPVNHSVAHIEIGRLLTESKDPITVYVSGGNTQIIGYASGRYRIFGECMDIPIGNAIDVFIRKTTGENPGGPVMEKLAQGGSYIELPYVVKGMDLSFTGITTAAVQKWSKATPEARPALLRDLCFSFQETCYAMLTEVTERALAHTGKKEVLLVGGVAASKRFREMIDIMCSERGAKAFVCPIEYSGDQGAMIAWTGLLMYRAGVKPIKKIDYNSLWRTDQAEITWME